MGKPFCLRLLGSQATWEASHGMREEESESFHSVKSFQRKEKQRHKAHHFIFMRKFSLDALSGRMIYQN